MSADTAWLAANQRDFTAAVEGARGVLLAALAQRLGEAAPTDPPDPALLDPPARHRHLAERLGLTRFEHWLLMLAAGAEVDPEIRRLCAAWADDRAADRPSLALALAVHPQPHWSALAPDAPLRRLALIRLEPGAGLTDRPLVIDELVLHHLLGLDTLRLAAADRLERLAPEPIAADGRTALRALGKAVAAGPGLTGIAGEATGARGLAAALGRPLYAPLRDVPLAAHDPALERLALLEAAVLLVERAEDLPAAESWTRRMPVVAIGAAARGRARVRLPTAPIVAAPDGALADRRRHERLARLSPLATRIEPRARWDDLVLPPAQNAQLRQLVDQVRHRATVVEAWGFGAKSSRGLGLSALFAGPSGTGKTMASEVIAAELGHELYRVDLAALVSKYIGETEKQLERLFAAAEADAVVLLFDEADALFGKRGAVRDGLDRFANQEVSYLLQRIESFDGLAVLTTNLPDAIDPAFVRRFRFVINFPFPDHGQRGAIWQTVFPPQLPCDPLDAGRLARLSLSGGAIRNVALNGAYLAAAAGVRLGMDHLLQAAEAELAKTNQRLPRELLQ